MPRGKKHPAERIIADTRTRGRKAIALVTGVPGPVSKIPRDKSHGSDPSSVRLPLAPPASSGSGRCQ